MVRLGRLEGRRWIVPLDAAMGRRRTRIPLEAVCRIWHEAAFEDRQ